MAIGVMLIDDHPIVRQGIKSIISQEPDILVVAEASDGKEAVKLAKNKRPDVIIMDITLPRMNGLEACAQILKNNKNAKILVLTMHESRVFLEKALSCGVKGYILKESAPDEIVPAIRTVYAEKYYLGSKVSDFVVHDYVYTRKKSIRIKSISVLTPREREILQLIAEGSTNKDIARELNLSLKTVLVHRNNIMQKLDIHSQARLIRFALREGISKL